MKIRDKLVSVLPMFCDWGRVRLQRGSETKVKDGIAAPTTLGYEVVSVPDKPTPPSRSPKTTPHSWSLTSTWPRSSTFGAERVVEKLGDSSDTWCRAGASRYAVEKILTQMSVFRG